MRRIILTILTLAALLPSAAFAGVRYLCAMDGQVRTECCCPANADKQEPNVEPMTEMHGTCCCTVSTTTPTVAPQIKAETTHHGLASIPIVLPAPLTALPARQRVIVARAVDARPPKPDRTLFVQHCALLL